MNMSSYQYRIFYYKDRTVSWPSFLYNRNTLLVKTVFILRGMPVMTLDAVIWNLASLLPTQTSPCFIYKDSISMFGIPIIKLRWWNRIILIKEIPIYIIISQNIRYLLWNRGAWRFFHDTYLTIEVQGIRCTNHLHDSCPFTDVNPHFTAPGCRYHFKINSQWPIVTS